jgi:hypothetical protein
MFLSIELLLDCLIEQRNTKLCCAEAFGRGQTVATGTPLQTDRIELLLVWKRFVGSLIFPERQKFLLKYHWHALSK